MTEPDNKMTLPFGVTVPCHRYGCKVMLKPGDVAYNDGEGRLYCPEHNPKRTAGPSATKQQKIRAMFGSVLQAASAEIQRRAQELGETDNPGGRE